MNRNIPVSRLLIQLIFLIAVAFIVSCKKESDHTIVEIPLFRTTLDSLKQNVRGSWKLAFTKGGFVNQTHYFNNNFMTIFPTDSISWKEGNGIIAQSKLTYKWSRTVLGDSAYVLMFIDYNSTGPVTFLATKKRNDTLIMINNGYDYSTFYFIPN